MFKALTLSLATLLSAGGAWAVDYQFVRMSEPVEAMHTWHIGANIAGTGVVFMPRTNSREDLSVRVRMYRPIEGDVELFQEDTAEIGAPFRGQPGTYQYLVDLQRKVLLKPGMYLVRVDCFDVSDDTPTLLASGTVFLTAVDANAKNGGRRPLLGNPIAWRATRGFDLSFARISEPIEIARRGPAVEKIAVGGFLFLPDLEEKDDLDLRVRLYRPVDGDLDVVQEKAAEVRAGPPGDPGTYNFACDLKPAKLLKPGKYLVRVDCLNKRDSQPSLWASASEFLTIDAEPD